MAIRRTMPILVEALAGTESACDEFVVTLDEVEAARLRAYAAASGERAETVLSRLIGRHIAGLAQRADGEDDGA